MPWRYALLIAALGSGACIIIQSPDDDAGDDTEGSMPMDDTLGDDGTGPGACFDDPNCDPLSSECPGDARCVPQGSAFLCVPIAPDAELLGAGEACQSDLICQEGLLCVPSAGCTDGFGCCTPLCDVAQPQCPNDGPCSPYFSAPGPLCYEDVGLCL